MATTQVYGALRIELEDTAHGFFARAWRGKQRRPFACYRFSREESRAEWIAKQKAGEDARERYKRERAAYTVSAKAAMRERLQVGTILHHSWGYEQTNCEFYLVVERKAASCTIQRIGCTTVSGSEGQMSARVRPDPSRIIGKPERKIIGPAGVTMGHGHATPCAPESTHYVSWYA
jgi:hypothetical protein